MCEAARASAACHLSTASVNDCFCNREFWESQPCNASCCRSSPRRLPASLCLVYALFIERDGGWTPFTHKEEKNKTKNWDEIQVRSHPETRRQGLACERRPPQRCGYFWSRKGFTQWVYITEIPLVSALKRNCSTRLEELKQLSVNFRSHINWLYKYDICP